MDKNRILEALEAGEFSGLNHVYQSYSGYNKHESYQIEMRVIGSEIKVVKFSRGKTFNGKENERYEDSITSILTGSKAVSFIESRPYYFSQIRPDLF